MSDRPPIQEFRRFLDPAIIFSYRFFYSDVSPRFATKFLDRLDLDIRLCSDDDSAPPGIAKFEVRDWLDARILRFERNALR